MKILLASLTEGVPVEVRHEFDSQALGVEFVDLKYKTQPVFLGIVEKGADTLSVRGSTQALIERVCGRCLKVIEDKIELSTDLYYEIKNKEFIDTTDDIREQLIIEHPLVYLCREACKGLCPQCGTDLNTQKCQCREKASKSPFSVLENLKKNKKNQE